MAASDENLASVTLAEMLGCQVYLLTKLHLHAHDI
jgi:hypothetical protein